MLRPLAILRALLLALLLAGSTHILRAQERGKPTGPLAIAQLDFPDLTDAARTRRVPITVHYPTSGGPYPLVIYSHGGGGARDSHLYEARHMASHGYVVLCLEHVHSNAATVRALTRAGRGTLRARFRAALLTITRDPRAVLGRPRDVRFAIDRAIAWNTDHAVLKGRCNTAKIAVAGHSFGAGTTLAACGARLALDYLDDPPAPGKGLAPSLADPRVTIGIAMSPQGVGTSRFHAESFATVRRPLLCFSGTKDDQFGHDGSTQPAARRLEAWKRMPAGTSGAKYMAWLENADHLAFADNPHAWKLPSRSRADTQRIVKSLTLAFADAYLKGDARARARLSQSHLDSLVGRVVTRATWHARE